MKKRVNIAVWSIALGAILAGGVGGPASASMTLSTPKSDLGSAGKTWVG